jgi:serine phosphatase RsbU (regulator of sigma subunit)
VKAAAALREDLLATTSAFAGVDALAIEGEVSEDEFAVFGTDVVAAAGLEAVAYSRIVPASLRTAWEAETGEQIKDSDGAGGFRPAPTRPQHVVVTYTVPSTELTRRVIGLDLRGDPIRAAGIEAADASPGTALVAPVSLATSGQPGLFAIRAVRDATGATLGYVASGIGLDAPLEQIQRDLSLDEIDVAVDSDQIRGDGQGGASSSFVLAGRTFAVRATSDHQVNWSVPIVLGIATGALAGSAVEANRRNRKERIRQQRVQSRAGRLRELAEVLASTTSTGAVMRQVADNAGEVLGAAHTNVGRPMPGDPSKLEVIHDTTMDAELSSRFALQDMSAPLPLTECARDCTNVSVTDRAGLRSRYPLADDARELAGIESVLCVPLSLGSDRSVGVIGFAFDHELDSERLSELTTVAELVSQMTGRAYERALGRELIEERVGYLGDFTSSLTSATTVEEVEQTVGRFLPPLLDLESASVAAEARTIIGSTVRSYPSTAPGELGLHLRSSSERRWTATEESLARTVSDLTQAALARARLYDEQREVLVRLQGTLLSAPPKIDGLDVAVGYRPALGDIGMGGDWYSVIDTPDRVYAVVGDVVGHGSEAIAVMAEVKTILRHLLTMGTPLDEALDQADLSLQRRSTHASAAIVEIDKHQPMLRYVNAGHLPSLVLGDGETRRLEEVHRPWLGTPRRRTAAPATVTFDSDALLVLYTDGLVEERGEVIDAGIDRLAASIDPGGSAQAIVDGLLTNRSVQRSHASVDDDIAVVAIRRLRLAGP